MKYIRILITSLILSSILVTSAVAIDTDTVNQNTKNFSVDNVEEIEAETSSIEYSGKGYSTTETDTRTAEEIAEDNRVAEAAALEKEIQDIMSQIDAGTANDSAWSQIPEYGEWLEENGGGVNNVNGDASSIIGTTTLPDWSIEDQPNIDLSQSPTQMPTAEELLNQYKDLFTAPPTIENTYYPGKVVSIPIITPTEIPKEADPIVNPDSDFTGFVAIQNENNTIIARQGTVPIGTVTVYAKSQSGLKKINQEPLKLPDDSPTITFEDKKIGKDELTDDTGKSIEVTLPGVYTYKVNPTVVDQIPLNYEQWLDDFKDWVLEQMKVQPGQVSTNVENQFIRNPNIDGINDMFGNKTTSTTIPGTDIEIAMPKDYSALYELLLKYTEELNKLNMTSVNVTKFTIYQLNKAEIQTVHKSIPTNQYHWVVTGPGGLVDKYTDSAYAKLLFRATGTYNVQVENYRQVYRNNKVSGTKSDIWVLSNGDYFDGLVVYKSSTSFSGYISEDIGPTMEWVNLKENGFNALVTSSMLNTIQIVDDSGNIRSPANDFTTERN